MDGGNMLKNVKDMKDKNIVDPETGEVYTLKTAAVQKADENFYKVFMKEFEECTEGISSRQFKLILWIIKHMSLKNELKYTYREIAEKSGVSLQTVLTTMKSLEEHNFLCRSGKILIINPNAVFKGRYNKRAAVFASFRKAQENAEPISEKERLEMEEELERIRGEIKKKMSRVKELKELEQLKNEIQQLKRDQTKLRERLENARKVKTDEKTEPENQTAGGPETGE